jgi:hypothetical protein
MSKDSIKGVYGELRQIFEVQFNEFVKQFIESDIDLDKFFDSAELDMDFLESIISDWCEKEEPQISETIQCLAAIFMLAFIEQVDKETAQDETEESKDSGPLG